MTKRIGFRMREAAEYVAAHPGTTKSMVARAVFPKSNRYGYAIVDRAIKAGIISAERLPVGIYVLNAVAGDK